MGNGKNLIGQIVAMQAENERLQKELQERITQIDDLEAKLEDMDEALQDAVEETEAYKAGKANDDMGMIKKLEAAFEQEKQIQDSLSNARNLGIVPPYRDTLRWGREPTSAHEDTDDFHGLDNLEREGRDAYVPYFEQPERTDALRSFIQDREQRRAFCRKLCSLEQWLLSENTCNIDKETSKRFTDQARDLIEMLKPLVNI